MCAPLDRVQCRRNTGAETERTRDLFLALWVPDAFMRAVVADGDWWLMTPDACPGLQDAFGDAFDALYAGYVAAGKFTRRLKARTLWQHVLTNQMETGTPYVCFKDHVNRKSNHANIGTVRSSNLCVAPETMVLTAGGWQPIECLCDLEVEVWNGAVFSKTTVRRTGENQPLLRVAFSNGEALECTPYHKFYVSRGGSGPVLEVAARDLSPGDALAPFEFPVVESCPIVPVGDARPPEERVAFLERVADGLGGVTASMDGADLVLCAPNASLHKRTLNTLGADGALSEEGDGLMRLRIAGADVAMLRRRWGFAPTRVDLAAADAADAGARPRVRVTAVEDTGRRDDTYCFNEPLAHRGMFNGILTGNCAEAGVREYVYHFCTPHDICHRLACRYAYLTHVHACLC